MNPIAPLMALARLTRVDRIGRPSRGTVRPPEPADLGTAFGMECWLDEQAAPGPVAAAPAPQPRAAGWRWWPRARPAVLRG